MASWAWGILEVAWANLWANLGQTLANLCVFLANPSGNGLERARILRKKWDGRHRVKSAKCPYYNTNREPRPFFGGGWGRRRARGQEDPTPPPPRPPPRILHGHPCFLEFYQGAPASRIVHARPSPPPWSSPPSPPWASKQVGRSAGRQVARSAGRRVGRSAGRQFGRSALGESRKGPMVS